MWNNATRALLATAVVSFAAGYFGNDLLRSHWRQHGVQTNEPDGNSSQVSTPKPRLDQVCLQIRTDGEKQSREDFRNFAIKIERDFSADPYALAKVAYSKAEIYRDIFRTIDDERESLDRAIECLHNTEREVLLLQMRVRLSLARLHNRSGDRKSFLTEIKAALALEGKAVPLCIQVAKKTMNGDTL